MQHKIGDLVYYGFHGIGTIMSTGIDIEDDEYYKDGPYLLVAFQNGHIQLFNDDIAGQLKSFLQEELSKCTK